MGQVLLLNADYNLLSVNPLSTIHWQNAIKLEYQNHATAIEYYDDWVVHSPSVEMPVPSVMVLNEFKKFRRGVKFSLRNLYLRDDYTCQYCLEIFSEEDLSKDHVVPKTFGGKTNWENIVTACKVCNHRRGHNTQIQPRKAPYKPTIYEIESKVFDNPVHAFHKSWIPHLTSRGFQNIVRKF